VGGCGPSFTPVFRHPRPTPRPGIAETGTVCGCYDCHRWMLAEAQRPPTAHRPRARRREDRSSSLPTAVASPPGSCPRGGGHRGRAAPSGRAGSRQGQVPTIVVLASRATCVPQAAVPSGMQRSATVTPTEPLRCIAAPDLGDRRAEKLHGMQEVKHPSKRTTHRSEPLDAASGEGDGATHGLGAAVPRRDRSEGPARPETLARSQTVHGRRPRDANAHRTSPLRGSSDPRSAFPRRCAACSRSVTAKSQTAQAGPYSFRMANLKRC
jgi:hypothetical protein